MNALLKALLASAFFVAAPAFASERCPTPDNGQTATLDRVIDGDTLRLADGRRLRLIGVDTPERARDGRAAEPLAEQATRAARRFLANQPLRLQPGTQPQDRHGRLLAHVFNHEGASLEAHLLRRGLGFQITMPPDLVLRDCLRAAEQQARREGAGVWSNPYFAPRPVRQLGPNDGGFGRYRGRVTASGRNRGGLFLELEQRVFLSIAIPYAHHFDATDLDALRGQEVEVRGWLSHRTLSAGQRAKNFRPFRIRIRHPDAITPLKHQ